jgi:hypothetical protein
LLPFYKKRKKSQPKCIKKCLGDININVDEEEVQRTILLYSSRDFIGKFSGGTKLNEQAMRG